MSVPSPPPPQQVQIEDEDWLPQDFQPLSLKQLVWRKLKNAPLVGVGIAATLGSLFMAAYQMRLGNSQRFNYWLRWRVGSQVFTIGTFVYYGGVAFTREQQDQYMTKTMILLGDLPKDHPTTGSHPVPPRPTDPNAPPPPPVTDDPAYPRAVEDRMRVSDFATRLRQAEIAQRKEDEAKDRALANSDGGQSGGVQAVSGPGELLKRRAERETERRPGVSEMERNEEIARDVERHIEVRDRTEKKI